MFGIDDSRLVVGPVELAPSELQAFVNGTRTPLTRREFEVLHALALCAGHVVTRERLYEHIWHHPMHPRERSVDVHVQRLRTRLAEVSPGWRYIHTDFGVGYRFEPEQDDRGAQEGSK
jgi:DNA-binding response OmpR family regulator